MVSPLWKTVWQFLKKLKIELPYDPENPISEYLSKRITIRISRRYLHSHVYCSTIHSSQDTEITQISTDE